MMGTVHFTSGGGRIRPVVNLSVPTSAESFAGPFPLTLTPLRGGGVEDTTSVLIVEPFIVVIERRLVVGTFGRTAHKSLHFTCASRLQTTESLDDVRCIQTNGGRQRGSLVVRICYLSLKLCVISI